MLNHCNLRSIYNAVNILVNHDNLIVLFPPKIALSFSQFFQSRLPKTKSQGQLRRAAWIF
jgi:hypothetical protein